MPELPAYICKYCNQIVKGRCGCRRPDNRPKTKDRGYAGSGTDSWPKFRKALLEQRGWLCEDCGEAKAVDVHHKIKVKLRPDLRLVPWNCMILCGTCHKRRTGRGE